MEWSNDIENLLEEIRQNSINLSNSHKNSYFFYKKTAKYFRLPTIILSSINGVASVGLTNYLDQQHISGLVCLLSVVIGIKKVQKQKRTFQKSHKSIVGITSRTCLKCPKKLKLSFCATESRDEAAWEACQA